MNHRMYGELSEIVLALGVEEATERQLATLDELIRTDPEARSYVARIMHQQACLAWRGPSSEETRRQLRILQPGAAAGGNELARPVVAPSQPLPAQDPSARRGGGRRQTNPWLPWRGFWPASAWPALGFAAAVLLCVGFSVGWISKDGGLRGAGDVQLARQLEPVAHLTSVMGCTWGSGAFDPSSAGEGIRNGEEVTLLEGLAQLRLATGATLDIEGPAALVLTSTQSLILQYGKVVVNLPQGAGDLRVQLPTCRLNATEGEFGIRAAGGDVDLHVFTGGVEAALSPFEDDSLAELPDIHIETIFVAEGRAVTLANEGGVSRVSRWHDSEKSEFATKLSMAGTLPITEKYVQAVMGSKPFAYWRFESSADERVLNEMGATYPLHVFGEMRWAGDTSNRVADFGAPGDRCGLMTNERVKELQNSDYSIEFWMKPSHFHHGALVSLIGVQRPTRDLHAALIELRPPYLPANLHSRIRFLHRQPAALMYGTSCYSKPPYRLRSWQHVVAVKDSSAMRLYVDGEQVAVGTDVTSILVPPYVLLGQLHTNLRERAFVGQMDELAIYNRALPADELLAHFWAVDWHNQLRVRVHDVEMRNPNRAVLLQPGPRQAPDEGLKFLGST